MDTESSNDVVLIESDINNDVSDGSFMKLLESLITNDNMQNTVLTNAQLIVILQKEFDFDVTKLYELEVEIYLNIVKKYLKDWPEWDNFEKSVIDLKTKNDNEKLKEIIKNYYLSLKNYLHDILDIAKQLAPNAIKNLPDKPKVYCEPVIPKNKTGDDIVMEVQATREQLNNLVLRYPTQNNNIFNCDEPQINMYSCNNCSSLDSILNMSGVKVDIEIQWSKSHKLVFKYENKHRIHLSLVNKIVIDKNKYNKLPNSQLNQEWQTKMIKPSLGMITKEDLLQVFGQYVFKGDHLEWRTVVRSMEKTLKNILQTLPPNISIPADFRRYLSEHSFVRHMYKDNKKDDIASNQMYDIRLQEIISPLCELHFALHPVVNKEDTVKITCTQCQVIFTGLKIVRDVEFHFRNTHSFGQDWQCMHCCRTIPLNTLTEMRWQHNCTPNYVQ